MAELDAGRDGRATGEFRALRIDRDASAYAEGSCLIRMGSTHVLCAASVEEGVPGWRKGSGAGWVTAEYAMLPRATQQRTSQIGRASSREREEDSCGLCDWIRNYNY